MMLFNMSKLQHWDIKVKMRGNCPSDFMEMNGLVGQEPQIHVKNSNKAGVKNMVNWTEESIIHKEITQQMEDTY